LDPSDAELIQRTLNGDERAFDDLVARHRAPIFALVRKIVGRAGGDADDLTNTAFLKGYRGLTGFRPDAKLRPWLMKIASNTAIDWLRVQARIQAQIRRNEEGIAGKLASHVGGQKQLAHDVCRRSKDWVDKYLDSQRAAKLRQGALMRLLGKEYLRIAEECGYRTADSARLTIHSGIESAVLTRPGALEEACDIQAQYGRIAGLDRRVLFLNVLDVEILRNRREATHG